MNKQIIYIYILDIFRWQSAREKKIKDLENFLIFEEKVTKFLVFSVICHFGYVFSPTIIRVQYSMW